MKLLDTNVVIYFFTRHPLYYESVSHLIFDMNEDYGLSALTYFEVFYGVSIPERPSVKSFLVESFHIFDVTRGIAEQAAVFLADSKKKARQLKIDALIGTTALIHGIPLVTNNPKDFEWIPGLQVEILN